jgi:DnaD/phage-associated family protein
VVKYGFRYEKLRGANGGGFTHARLRYVENVVKSWVEKGLATVGDVEADLENHDKRHYNYKRVLKALGMSRRATEEERRIMDTWFGDMSFAIDAVLEACKKTSGITNPNINYVNKILAAWHSEGRQGGGGPGGGKRGDSAGKRQIAEVFRMYERLREKGEAEADSRRDEVYARVPEIKRLDQGIRARNLEISKTMLSGAANAQGRMEKLRADIEKMKSDKAFLMTENNFNIDYMDIKYVCENCKDTGVDENGERCACFAGRLAEVQSKG